MPLENLHTHTWRCQHASGDVEDYILESQKKGCESLGFSDHTPLPDGRWSRIRMDITQLPDYIAQVNRAKDSIDSPKVYLGLECEWAPEFRDFYENEILPAGNFDYLIGAVHFFPFQGDWLYLEKAVNPPLMRAYAAHMEKTVESGFFSFIAHPDAFLAGYGAWDENTRSCARDIFNAASEHKMVLEINGNGFRKKEARGLDDSAVFYPYREFWEMAEEYGIQAVCSSDAHTPGDVCGSIEKCVRLADDTGISVLSAAELVAI